jgi:hypothetical protein
MPVDDQQTPGEAGNGGRTQQATTDAPDRLNASLEALRQSIDKQTGSIDKQTGRWEGVLKVMREIAGAAEGVADEFTGMATSAEDLVKYVGTARDRLKALSTEAKKLGTNLGTTTFKKAAEQLRIMREEAERLAKSGNLTRKEMNDLNTAIRKCVDGEQILSRHQTDFNAKVKSNKEEYRKIAEILRVVQDRTIAITQRVKTGGLNQKIMNIATVLGRGGGRVEKAHRTAQAAYEKRQELGDVRAENRKVYEKNRKGSAREIRSRLDAAGVDYRNAGGGIDPKKWKSKEVQNIVADTLTDKVTENSGGGFLNRKLVGWALKNQRDGGGGFVSKAITNMAEQGGGSVAAGAAGGIADIGLGGLTKMAGPAGIVMAAGGALEDLVDHIAKQNQETEKNLGKGGIFTTGVGGGNALMNVRQNLMAYGLNAHNVTTERQMAVAQTMQEEGAGLSELSRPSKGFFEGNPRSVGDVGDIVFKQAREVGLSDVEGTKQVMKMLQTYKMTLTGTQDFFRTIGKDIHAAGISTTKYLQLIDDVTDQFGSMNKSIATTTSLLRVLGSTGTSTYDQLKEDVGAITENKAGLEQRAVLFQMQKQNPAMSAEFVKTQMDASKNAADALADGINTAIDKLGMNKEDVWKGTGGDAEKALTQFQLSKPNTAEANALTIPLEGTLRQYQAAHARAMVAQGVAQGDYAVQNAAVTDLTGKTPEGNIANNLQRMGFVLEQQKTGFGAALKNPAEAVAVNSVLMDKLTEALGGDSSKVMNILNEAANAITTEVRGMKEGKLSGAFESPQEEEQFYENTLKKAGPAFSTAFKPGQAKELVTHMGTEQLGQLAASLKQNAGVEDVYSLLADPNNPIAKALNLNHTEEKSEQERNTAEIAQNTTTIADRLAVINGNILSKLGQPLMMLVDAIVRPSAEDKINVQMASEIGKDTQFQMDDATVGQIVKLDNQRNQGVPLDKQTHWTDVMGPMPNRTAADIWQNVNALQEKQKSNGGTLMPAEAKELLDLIQAEEAMAGHAKFQQLTPFYSTKQRGTGLGGTTDLLGPIAAKILQFDGNLLGIDLGERGYIADMEKKILGTTYSDKSGFGLVETPNPVANAAQGQVGTGGAATKPAAGVIDNSVHQNIVIGTPKTPHRVQATAKQTGTEQATENPALGADNQHEVSVQRAISGGLQ